jgi:predicted glycoside hydrolase/deacetylase ChbG (UPF0249 family)/glycosyltransferase involved in cell wall biosynthesis
MLAEAEDRLPEEGAQEHAPSVRAARPPCAQVIVNADDWGRNPLATDRMKDCVERGAVSSVSAMVFMDDSERAAEIAREHGIDAGLHLNLTAPFAAGAPAALAAHQQRIARFLLSGRFAPMVNHPKLASSFEYAVKAQLEEFERLYGAPARHIDGHHHAHLAANVLRQELLPAGTLVRRNFTFAAGEKGVFNRWYRRRQDERLARRHPITDYFFNLAPMEPERLRRILEAARHASVEIETHPERDAEYRFLMDGGLDQLGYDVAVKRGYRLRGGEDIWSAHTAKATKPHICVCICTYKRPEPLKRLLCDLGRQSTGGRFTYSIVVADNDEARSGEAVVEEARRTLGVPVTYCAEPRRGIARARNCVVANAAGDYVAMIDDDEFPDGDWLLKLLETCLSYDVDGVLGPVRRYFDAEPPAWLKRSSLYDRAVHPTGTPVAWPGARTGNALVKREVFGGEAEPFRVDFKAGEDQDFFRRKIGEGRAFVWSAEAVAHEVLPPARWKRMYYVRKSLLHGGYSAKVHGAGVVSIAKSLVAVPLYTLGLPLALLAGGHRFMTLLVKLCEHIGKLLFVLRIRPIREEYVSD